VTGAGNARKAAAGRAKAERQTGGVVDHLRPVDVSSVSKECEVCCGHIITCPLGPASASIVLHARSCHQTSCWCPSPNVSTFFL